MNEEISTCLDQYDSISLNALNSKAEMLERLDNKYIVPGDVLLQALRAMASHFDVLDIGGRRSFSYATRYFDDSERRGYYDHHQRKRRRCKARIRYYVDSGLTFFEVKLNERRAATAKRRLPIDAPLAELNTACLDFVRRCYRDCYGDEFTKPLQPVILIEYERITLVAKQGGERLTIDTAMRFRAECCEQEAPPDMFIVETKSARANGLADKFFRALHVQPTRRVSKFCIGMAVTGQVVRHNGFLPALRKLQLEEAARRSASLACSVMDIKSRTTTNELQECHSDPGVDELPERTYGCG